MFNKYISILREHNILELCIYLSYQIRMRILQTFSTLLFKVKCKVSRVCLGRGACIWGTIILNKFPGSRITIGDSLRVVSNPTRYSFNIFSQSKIRTMSPTSQVIIGNEVGFNSINILCRSQRVVIGDRTMIGGNCQIMDSDCHPLWPPQARWHYPGNEHDKEVIIGSDVFIGLNVIVTRGSVIGDNSVIAAGSVVSGTIPPNCLAGGVPAKVLKVFE